jgi:hypothetical protein
MAVFSTQIRDLKESERPLFYKCQETYYTLPDIKSGSIKAIEKSYNYSRVYYPNSSFKSFYDLSIDFDPFDETVRCYLENQFVYTNNISATIVRPFLIKLSSPYEDIIDIFNNITMLEGKAYMGTDNYELFKGIKELAKINQLENFISEVKQGMFSCSRYIPNVTEFIETIDEADIIDKLSDCYKILLNDIDENKAINYEKIIALNLERINIMIIKPIIINILAAPKYLFEIFMTPFANIDEHRENVFELLKIKKKNLLMLECIKSFSKFIKIYVDSDAFIDEKGHVNKESDILPVHRLAYWEIVKYIHSIFKDKYIAMKMSDTQIISCNTNNTNDNNNSNNTNDSDNDSDSDVINLDKFFDVSETSTSSFATPSVKKFMPELYNDFYDFKISQFNTIPINNLHFDIDSLNDKSRNIILQELDRMISFDVYKQLLPKRRKESLFVTGHYAKP